MKESFTIVPYSPEYEEALLDLERMSPQGFLIKLQTERHHFHSKAVVFEDYQTYVAIDDNNIPIACAIGAQVPICLNNKKTNAGYGFSARVAPRYRNQGIGQELAEHLSRHFFEPRKLQPQFTTLRTSNLPVQKLLSRSHRGTFQYEFTYLTFSTARGIQVQKATGPESPFQVDLLSSHERLTDYYRVTDSGVGLWNTYKLYQLKITSISPLAKAGFWMENLLKNNTRVLPNTDVVIKTVTAYNLNQTNIDSLRAIALQLYKEGVNYLQVCCQPGDFVYRSLHKSALNAYSYYIVSTLEMKAQEPLVIDIRCM